MQVIHAIENWQGIRSNIEPIKSIGFVPTMGNLHLGHASLLAKARAENDISVLSIFVNPTQFNNKADFEKYPKTLEEDLQIAKECGVDYVLVFEKDALYPDDYQYQVHETNISTLLEGKFRPGHFTGVLTIVLKLLMLVKATRAYFGEKDFQQLVLVQGMVRAFFMDVKIIACPTIRLESGLAFSSRNNRLTKDEFNKAETFAKLLASKAPLANIIDALEQAGISVEYLEKWQDRLLAAVTVGEIRLIDNISDI
ncbi:MAG: pantoate--beta-alanine ligase [Proteobacteria bacterium]|nr:pantoate--beta-alanine ligase [Pseudomonadota bacterium]